MDLSWLAPLIPVIIPVVGALATVLTARLGIGGRLRRLDLLSARLKLTQSLLDAVREDDALKERLQYQVNDIAAEMITDYGDIADQIQEIGAEDLAALRDAPGLPQRWEDFGWLRRRVLLPFPAGIVGKGLTAIYYYLLLVSVLGIPIILSEAPEEQGILVLSLLLIWAFTYGFGRMVKKAYLHGYQTALERRLVRIHLQHSQM